MLGGWVLLLRDWDLCFFSLGSDAGIFYGFLDLSARRTGMGAADMAQLLIHWDGNILSIIDVATLSSGEEGKALMVWVHFMRSIQHTMGKPLVFAFLG